MDIYDTRRARLRRLIDEKFGKKQRAFADAIGRQPDYISRVLRGGKNLGEDFARFIERELLLPALWLDQPDDAQHANTVAARPGSFARMGPVISYARASGWEAAADPFMPGDADDWLPLPRLAREGSFWLRVRGESMFDPGDRVSFPDGCYICCDPSRNDPVNKAFVIARRAGYSGDDAVTFKQYINEDGSAWLRPLNRQYEPIRDNFTIIGTVMGRYDEF